MDEIYARLSKAGRIVCGRPGADGRYTCDEPLAERMTRLDAAGRPWAGVAALDGWILDKKGIWQRTTRVEDRRAHGLAAPRMTPEQRTYPDLPTLARCPKCRAVQWLEAERLGVAHLGAPPARPSRWLVREPMAGQGPSPNRRPARRG